MAFADYSNLFQQGEQKYNLRPGTGAALMSLEDASGNPYARSPAGAQGILQLMPGTAQQMGVSNPNDPAQNIDGGLHYFSTILNGPAHGDYRMAAMGYNAGPNRSSFPQSTQSYADQFMSRLPQSNPTPQPQSGAPPVPSLGSLANPVDTGADAIAAQPMNVPSLGAMAQSMPAPPVKAPSKFNAGNILGVLGDALSAYGGRQPTFGPFLQQQQMMDRQQAFEREKFNQQMQMQLFAMTHPAEFMQANLYSQLPPDQQRNYLGFQDATHPLYTTVNGSQVLQKRIQTPPPEAVAHLRGALGAGADRASETAKFDQIFGPGAAAEALGGQ